MFPRGAKRSEPTTVVYVNVRRDLVLSGAPVAAHIEDINQRLEAHRGIVLGNGQLLTRALDAAWLIDTWFADDMTGEWDFPRRPWGEAQARYFSALLGVDAPFRFEDHVDLYGRYYMGLRLPGAYLAAGERILGLVDAGCDQRDFDCPCHFAEVVYTSAHRLVCMACGQMHCVLATPLADPHALSWSEADWDAAFDASGVLRASDVRIPFIEYQDVFAAPKTWTTDAWQDASGEIEFFARGDPDEIARFRATQATAQDLIEAGFSKVPQTPAPARQMEADGFGVDIAQNAALAVNAAAGDYARSQTNPAHLRSAVLNLFHAIELVLKIKMEAVAGDDSARRWTNPKVLEGLAAVGVKLDDADLEVVSNLRKLRNKLQHAEARFGFADTRAMLERGFAFLDVFVVAELGWRLGDAVEQPGWDALLDIAPIRTNALAYTATLVADWRADQLNGAGVCAYCAEEAVLREWNRGGFCVYCQRMEIRPLPDDLD